MRKIDNKFENIGEISIMATANLCLENQKQVKQDGPRRVRILIILVILMAVFSLFGNPLLVFANVASLISTLVSVNTFKISSKAAVKSMCTRMAVMTKDYSEMSPNYYDDVEVEIVPKNMKIGENLEAINVVPIFKEGKYVIIKSYDYPVFMRVFDDEGKEEVYVMEATDEDLEVLESELPEYQEYIDVLKLQKTPSFLS